MFNLFCSFLKQKTKKLYFFYFHPSFPSNVAYSFDYKYWLFSSGSFLGRSGGNRFDNNQHPTAGGSHNIGGGFDSWSTHPTQESKKGSHGIGE